MVTSGSIKVFIIKGIIGWKFFTESEISIVTRFLLSLLSTLSSLSLVPQRKVEHPHRGASQEGRSRPGEPRPDRSE